MKSFAVALVACTLTVTLSTPLLAQDAGGTVDDALLAKLQGEWRYAGMTVNGKPQVRDWDDEDVSTFFEGTAMAERQGKTGKAFPDSPDRKVTHLSEKDGSILLDVLGDTFAGKNVTTKHLGKLDGDTLTVTYHMMNPGERPATLESTPGSFLWTVVYKLRKPAPPAKPAPAAKAAAHKPRTWKSTAGTTIEATFVELDGDVVVLEKKNGDELRVPLEKLSAMDRKWVKDAGKK
ncbi:MAG: SHD1 domain-containing protein [Planctomycetaceae bacterium]